MSRCCYALLKRRDLKRALLLLAGVGFLAASQALAIPVIDSFYAGSYSLVNLGGVPGVPVRYGGINFLAGDPNTLLLGGNANDAAGEIDTIEVIRDGGGHVAGFVGTASLFSAAPFIDGGLAYGPGGVLFFTGYPVNVIGQIKPGSTSPDKTVTAPVTASVGSLAFVPAGFAGAGNLAIASYNDGTFCQAPVTPDGTGTFDIGACGTTTILQGGLEGIVYVPVGSALFPNPSILVSEFDANLVSSYELDGSGNPIVGTRRVFISDLSGAERAVLDPTNNDFLFSTFGGSNDVLRVSGFAAPPPDVPEPSTVTMLAFGFAGLLGFARKLRD